MKANKFLVAALIILLVCFIAQTAYVFKLKKHNNIFNISSSSGFKDKKFPSFSKTLSGNWHDDFYRNFGPAFDKNWDPFKEMEKMQALMNKMFRESIFRIKRYGGLSLKENEPFFIPDLDIRDLGNNYMVKIDIPGMDKSKINVEVKGNQLIVSGERKEQSEENINRGNSLFYKRERSFGEFYRSITLPPDAGNKGISADYKRGVLTITIPKRKVKKPVSSGTKINVL
ncbi:MAG: hypothetical protein B1H08_06640 [Candidatus Omnitrophica bacterium 4484_171]|nr:MAG: hypothetical protein B1H08_06640 [Candidatus Omnitrophica bacterium 4484_171]